MRNSNRFIKALVILLVFILAIKGLDLMLYPCTFMRNDVHSISTESFDDIVVGTSAGKMGIDPAVMEDITGRTGHNLCVGGEYPIDAYYLIKLAIEKQKPTRIIYEVDPSYFVVEKEEGNNYLLFYHEFPLSMAKFEYFLDTLLDCGFRNIAFPWYEYSLSMTLPRISETLSKKLSRDYSIDSLKTEAQEYTESGFIARTPVEEKDFPPALSTDKFFTREMLRDKNVEYLDKLITLCKKNNIDFIAVTIPYSQKMMTRYESGYQEAWDFFVPFFEERDVRYYNFNTEFYDRFTHQTRAYVDYNGHLNRDAARQFSKILAETITAE